MSAMDKRRGYQEKNGPKPMIPQWQSPIAAIV